MTPSIYEGGVTVAVLIWNALQPSLVAETPFFCIDTTLAFLEYTFPSSLVAGTAGIVDVAIKRFGFVSTASLVQGLALNGTSATLKVVHIVSSSSDRSVLRLLLSSRTPGTVSFIIFPCSSKMCVSRNVSFSFLFLDSGTVRVSDFSPLSVPTYGRTLLSVSVENLPASTVPSDLIVQLGGYNLTVATITFPVRAELPSQIECVLPSARAPATVAPILLLLSSSSPASTVSFPELFSFTEPPALSVNVQPNSADLTKASNVIVTVSNFPGISQTGDRALGSQVAVDFVQESGIKVSALVESYTRADTSIQPRTPQTVILQVTTPVGSNVMEGVVTMYVYNTEFPSRFATSVFAFVDPTMPRVSSLTGAGGSGPGDVTLEVPLLTVPIRTPIQLTVLIQNSPTAVDVSRYKVEIDGQNVNLEYASYQSSARSAKVVFTASSRSQEGVLYGFVAFGITSCKSECCETGICTSACGDVKTACFSLSFYNDVLPMIKSVGPTSGPEIGGTQVCLCVFSCDCM